MLNLPIQINGKLRHTILVNRNINERDAINEALKHEQILKYITNGNYKKAIFVKEKILNFII
jgi:leucyl-tRNA synthetase